MSTRERLDVAIAEAREGDRVALAELYRHLHPPILRFLRAFEPAEAEDLASEVWLGVIAGLERFRGDEAGLRAWAFTIARSRMRDFRRRRRRRATSPASAEELERHGPSRDAEEEAMAGLATRAALAEIASLSRDQAEVVLLRVLGDLGVDQVAAVMGKRPGTVRVIQHRALRRLAQRISRQDVTG